MRRKLIVGHVHPVGQRHKRSLRFRFPLSAAACVMGRGHHRTCAKMNEQWKPPSKAGTRFRVVGTIKAIAAVQMHSREILRIFRGDASGFLALFRAMGRIPEHMPNPQQNLVSLLAANSACVAVRANGLCRFIRAFRIECIVEMLFSAPKTDDVSVVFHRAKPTPPRLTTH